MSATTAQVPTLPGKEPCPGHLEWSAFGANYPDTVCASALEWPDGYQGSGLCDADDDFREKDVPCPFCNAEGFIEYQWGSPGEYALIWADDETPVLAGTDIHFHDGRALWWTATDPSGVERRVLIRRLDAEDTDA